MKYYSLNIDKEYTDIPKTIKWYGRIDIESLMNYRYERLEKAYALEIKGDCELCEVDIIMDPIFAVSPMVKHCLESYEPNINYTSLYLVQCKEEKVLEYFIPHLVEEDCFDNSGNVLHRGNVVPKLGKVTEDRFIFRATDGRKKYIIMRDLLLESILKRGAQGIHLESVLCRE